MACPARSSRRATSEMLAIRHSDHLTRPSGRTSTAAISAPWLRAARQAKRYARRAGAEKRSSARAPARTPTTSVCRSAIGTRTRPPPTMSLVVTARRDEMSSNPLPGKQRQRRQRRRREHTTPRAEVSAILLGIAGPAAVMIIALAGVTDAGLRTISATVRLGGGSRRRAWSAGRSASVFRRLSVHWCQSAVPRRPCTCGRRWRRS